MNWKAVVLVLCLGALAWSRPAAAEKVKTNQSTKLYSRAGEQSPVVLKLKSGQSMTVLAKDGRWLKVPGPGRTGGIPRSKVHLPADDDEVARNTRRRPFVDGRGTKRGFGGESGPDDRIGADATGDGEEPAKPSKPSRSAKDSDDDEDAKPVKAAGKPAKAAGKPTKAARDSDDDEDARPAKARKPKDSDDDEDAKPVKAAGKPAKAAGKPTKAARDSDDDEDARPAKARKAKDSDDEEDGKSGRGGDDEGDDAKEPTRPMAHVAKATPIYNDPDSKSDESFTAQPKTALYVVEEKGKWTFVENEEGDAGYVLTSKLDIEEPAAAGPHGRTIDLRARVGGAPIVRQSLSTIRSEEHTSELHPRFG